MGAPHISLCPTLAPAQAAPTGASSHAAQQSKVMCRDWEGYIQGRVHTILMVHPPENSGIKLLHI